MRVKNSKDAWDRIKKITETGLTGDGMSGQLTLNINMGVLQSVRVSQNMPIDLLVRSEITRIIPIVEEFIITD